MDNYKAYGSPSQPLNILTESNIPTAIFVARNDYISTVEDGLNLNKLIKNSVHFQILEDEDHSSVIFSKNMTYFEDVIKVMMGSTYTIPTERRPSPPPKEDNGFSPIEDMKVSLNRRTESMKDSLKEAKQDFKDKVLSETVKAKALEDKVYSEVKAFNDRVDDANKRMYDSVMGN